MAHNMLEKRPEIQPGRSACCDWFCGHVWAIKDMDFEADDKQGTWVQLNSFDAQKSRWNVWCCDWILVKYFNEKMLWFCGFWSCLSCCEFSSYKTVKLLDWISVEGAVAAVQIEWWEFGGLLYREWIGCICAWNSDEKGWWWTAFVSLYKEVEFRSSLLAEDNVTNAAGLNHVLVYCRHGLMAGDVCWSGCLPWLNMDSVDGFEVISEACRVCEDWDLCGVYLMRHCRRRKDIQRR